MIEILTLAEPERYAHISIGEGKPMKALLEKMYPDDVGIRESLLKLLNSFGENEGHSDSGHYLVDPLNERQLEVLQLIAEGHTNRDMRARLFLSLNTVKVHTRNIYSKRDVHNRNQAVPRAGDLGLLASL